MRNSFGKILPIIFCFIFAFNLCFVGYVNGAQIEIALLHLDGRPIEEEITRSQPIIFQVSVDVSESFNVPTLVMPSQARAQLVSTNIITKGGKSRARYQYQVQIDELGTYRIGPAILKTSQGELVSDAVSVDVVDTPTGSYGSVHTIPHKPEGPFARLSAEKESYFVDERIEAKLRFYYRENFLECEELRDPNYGKQSAITISKTRGPVFGSEKIDGVTYKYCEWTLDFYCNKAGYHVLRPYRIDYSSGGASFFGIVGFARSQKSTYSNEVRLEIHDLPTSSVKAEAVGRFDSYTARLTPAVVHQGEATTLRFELAGDPINISDIPLKGLDASLKIYPATKSIERRSGRLTHIFEYVVQPKSVGDFTIPAQRFTFFDPEMKQYRTLSTQELGLSVVESGLGTKVHTSAPVVETLKQAYVIALDNRVQHRPPAPFSNTIFFLIMSLLLGAVTLLTIMKKQLCSFTFFKRLFGRYQAREWARQEIKYAYKRKQYHRLHGIVYDYVTRLARLYNVSSEGLLRKIGTRMKPALASRYVVFLTALEQTTFSQSASSDTPSAREIITWLPAIDWGVRYESK